MQDEYGRIIEHGEREIWPEDFISGFKKNIEKMKRRKIEDRRHS